MKSSALFLSLLTVSSLAWICPVLGESATDRTINLSIEDYVKRALEQGTKALLDAMAFEKAGYLRTIALRSSDSPTVSASYNASRSESDAGGSITHSESQVGKLNLKEPLPSGTDLAASLTRSDSQKPGISASIDQPLYLFVRNPRARSRRQTQLTFESAQENYQSALLVTRAQAKSLYYEVMLTSERIKVEERKANSSKKLLDITQALVEAGRTAAVETMRAKIRVQNDVRSLQNAEVSYEKALLAAKNFITVSLNQPIAFTTRLSFRPFGVSLNKLVDYALVHQPTLRALRRDVDNAVLSLQETREAQRPMFGVSGNYNFVQDDLVAKGWTLTGNVSWLLLDAFSRTEKVKVAKIGVDVASINLKEAEKKTVWKNYSMSSMLKTK